MIELDKISYSYGDSGKIFDNFSLEIGRGEAWTIIGPSGCGKSTLLSLLAGMLHPQSGRVVIDGEVITRARPRTGLVLQDHGLLPWATIRDNTELGLKIRKYYGPDGRHSPRDMETSKSKQTARVDYWLDWLGIKQFEKKYPVELSRGQRQRAAIARTLVLEPDLLLMDEPFSALDAPIREELQKVMNTFHQGSGLTSITVTHDIEEALVLGEKILVLSSGANQDLVVVENNLSGCINRGDDPAFLLGCAELRALVAKSMELDKPHNGRESEQ
ncbi:MAG: hypothetical protein CSA21_00470 [Deltaproteobacteria bacterium]|nr:MAG: hypothetical protein CSA21_00470 [Deltaproteobacteria bacterium]